MLDAYPNLEQHAAKPYPLLQMIGYINEMLPIIHSEIVELGQAISKLKEAVEANGQTIIELKAKVAKGGEKGGSNSSNNSSIPRPSQKQRQCEGTTEVANSSTISYTIPKPSQKQRQGEGQREGVVIGMKLK